MYETTLGVPNRQNVIPNDNETVLSGVVRLKAFGRNVKSIRAMKRTNQSLEKTGSLLSIVLHGVQIFKEIGS